MIEDYIDAIVEIGNHKRVLKECEPNVMQPLQLSGWMVVRTLKALELLENEWEIYQTARGTIQEREKEEVKWE